MKNLLPTSVGTFIFFEDQKGRTVKKEGYWGMVASRTLSVPDSGYWRQNCVYIFSRYFFHADIWTGEELRNPVMHGVH